MTPYTIMYLILAVISVGGVVTLCYVDDLSSVVMTFAAIIGMVMFSIIYACVTTLSRMKANEQ